MRCPSWSDWVAEADWKETLREMLDQRMLSMVRLNTHRGRPLGSDSFLRLPTKDGSVQMGQTSLPSFSVSFMFSE